MDQPDLADNLCNASQELRLREGHLQKLGALPRAMWCSAASSELVAAEEPRILKYISSNMARDRPFALAAVRVSAQAIKYVHPEFLQDRMYRWPAAASRRE